MQLFDSELLKDLLELHRAIDEAETRPGCLDTDPEVFFAERAGDGYYQAKKICAACPVIAQCAEYAIKWEEDGFFGGLAPRERLRLRALSRRSA